MAIMVVMALVTTFLTAPLSAVVYPLKWVLLRNKVTAVCSRSVSILLATLFMSIVVVAVVHFPIL